MRVFLAAFVHETNSFSPLPTTERSFTEGGLHHRAGDLRTLIRAKQAPGYGDALTAMTDAGDDVVLGTCAWAMPSGIIARKAFESLRDEVLEDLRTAGVIDAVLLFLHGAMVADGYPDCEGDILTRVRRIVGPKLPIGVLLDLHGNVSHAMIASDAILVACKEYPHTDYLPRARELRSLLAKAAAGEIKPRTLLRQIPMVAPLGTTENPMHDFVRRLEVSERTSGILSVSAMHGFAWSDVADMGASILVVHDDLDTAAASKAGDLATALARELFAIRSSGLTNRLPLDEALDAALAAVSDRGPVVFADSSDNPGGGAACDSTFVLQALLDRGVDNAALGMIWDPQAVLIAADAGVGALIGLRIGGKVGPQSGAPVDVLAEVIAVRDDGQQSHAGGGGDPMGLSVALRVAGIEIVLNSIRHQTFSPECFTELGIDLRRKGLIVVKSSQHFRARFDDIAAATIYCNSPGTLNFDLTTLPFVNIRRPIWPLDDIDAATAALGRSL